VSLNTSVHRIHLYLIFQKTASFFKALEDTHFLALGLGFHHSLRIGMDRVLE